MTRDASLDEFLGESGDDEGEEGKVEDEGGIEDADGETTAEVETDSDEDTGADADAGTTADEADATDGPMPPAEVEPARSTYAWSPEGAECAACGATVTERWRDAGRPVCADCKDWAGTPD